MWLSALTSAKRISSSRKMLLNLDTGSGQKTIQPIILDKYKIHQRRNFLSLGAISFCPPLTQILTDTSRNDPHKDTFGVQLNNEECARNVRVTSIDRQHWDLFLRVAVCRACGITKNRVSHSGLLAVITPVRLFDSYAGIGDSDGDDGGEAKRSRW